MTANPQAGSATTTQPAHISDLAGLRPPGPARHSTRAW